VRGPEDARRIALTFDDRADAAHLDCLDELGVPATFSCAATAPSAHPN
jgi:peptidoglycan/xylan/chitin deacetylase (PgdA/CDA1 family)